MIGIRGTDNTFGSGTLEGMYQMMYDKKTDAEKFSLFKRTEEFKAQVNSSWLLTLLCQYDRPSYTFGDMLSYNHLVSLVNDGLFMTLFHLDNGAFPDKMFNKNYDNVKKGLLRLGYGFSIDTKIKGNSDGVWEMDTPLKMKKIYLSDELTPKKTEEFDSIEILKPNGIVEFGTQKLCKSVMSLLQGDCLLRVPYRNSVWDTPVCAFFQYIKQ